MKKELLAAFAAMLMTPLAFGQGAEIVAPEVPVSSNNIDVRIIDDSIYRTILELNAMVSARVAAVSPDDLERIKAHFAWMSNVVATATSSISDTHFLASVPLSDIESTVVPLENGAIQACVGHLLAADVNLRVSQSSRINSSLLDTDRADLLDVYAKALRYVTDFAASDNPLDRNRMSPRVQIVLPIALP